MRYRAEIEAGECLHDGHNYDDFLGLFFQYVFKATSGKEALIIYEKESPDVIITDINMPNMKI